MGYKTHFKVEQEFYQIKNVAQVLKINVRLFVASLDSKWDMI